MPVLKYLADTNAVSDYFRPGNPVKAWFAAHRGEIGISTFTLAEIRRGIELKDDTKKRMALERVFDFVLEDYREAIYVFDEAAAAEWGRMMVEAKDKPIP
jgi:predicted nucleic acid-binding protein